jgi:hypothetical protein
MHSQFVAKRYYYSTTVPYSLGIAILIHHEEEAKANTFETTLSPKKDDGRR